MFFRENTPLPPGDASLPPGDAPLPPGDAPLPPGDTSLPSGDALARASYVPRAARKSGEFQRDCRLILHSATEGSTNAALLGEGGCGGEALSGQFHLLGQQHNIEYSANRPLQAVSRSLEPRMASDADRIVLLDARHMGVDVLRGYARRFDVQAVGPFWRVDRGRPTSFRALRYRDRDPNLFEQYAVVGTDRLRSIGPDDDAFATWEWRDYLGLPTADPLGEPSSFDDLRIAHNAAVARNDSAAAGALRARLAALMPDQAPTQFDGEVELLGKSLEPGAAPVATLLWRTSPAYVPMQVAFKVKCTIVAPPALWPSAVDFNEKDMAPPMVIPPASWKPGYLYAQRFVVRHRIGRERCDVAPSANDRRHAMGSDKVALFVMD